MIDFILENWKLIFEILILIGSVVFFIVKKKPTKIIEGVTEAITRLVPVFINMAEKTELKGAEKKQYVVLHIREALINLGFKDVYRRYIDSLSSELIEAYLSTPEKHTNV